MRIHWVLTETSDTLAEHTNKNKNQTNTRLLYAHVTCMRMYSFVDCFTCECFVLNSHATYMICFVSFQLIYLQNQHPETKNYNKKRESSTGLHHDRPKTTYQSRHDGTFKTRNKIHSHFRTWFGKSQTIVFSSSLRSHIHFGKCMCESAMVINFKMDEIHYTEWLSFIQTVFSSKYSLQLPTQNNLWNMVHFQKEYFLVNHSAIIANVFYWDLI